MLVEAGGVASAATGPGTFTSSTATPAVKATKTGKGFGIQATAQSAAAIRARKDVSAPRLRRVTLPDAPAHKAG